MNIQELSNESFLTELSERLNKDEIRIEGSKLMTKIEKRKSGYYSFSISLNIEVGKLVNKVISELREEKDLMIKEKERWEKELMEYKKQLKTG